MEESVTQTARTSTSSVDRPLTSSVFDDCGSSVGSPYSHNHSSAHDFAIGGLSPNAAGQNRLSVRNIRQLHLDAEQEPLLQHLRKYRATEFLARRSDNDATFALARQHRDSGERQTAPWKPAGNSRAAPRKKRSTAGADDSSTASASSRRSNTAPAHKHKQLSLEEQIREVEIEIRRVNGQKVWRMAPISGRQAARR